MVAPFFGRYPGSPIAPIDRAGPIFYLVRRAKLGALHEESVVTQPMIRIDGLTKSYGATQALRGVTFEVPRGQVVGFLGPNGAGKSTTMRILAGYVTPTS